MCVRGSVEGRTVVVLEEGRKNGGERHDQAVLSGHSAAGITGAPEERLARP